ncbi:MAG: DUF692 domain-containing protein [Myxococcales bacterium]|nr:DUF692 domain-containing protein [Myxococcales bacterium]MCB9644641.1 DUF692 domain-containing protein [Myxococcales bacterium]
MTTTPYLGHGIGLRTKHFEHLLEHPPHGVDWFEIISENFFDPGGRPWIVLDRVRETCPIVMHGVSLGIGNTDPLDPNHLQSLKTLKERIQPAWISDHLCWGAFGGHNSHDLLPLPYTEEAIRHIVPRIAQVQDFLGTQLLLENVSSYVTFQESEMEEWDFLREIAERADCKILLDVNNIYVSAFNHGFKVEQYLNAIPVGRVGQFHLAGHTNHGDYILDTHIGPVIEDVWDVYRKALDRFGPISALVEWDEAIPPFEEVVEEVTRSKAIEEAWRAQQEQTPLEKDQESHHAAA